MSKKRENDWRSMGHRGEWMTSEARFSTTPPSVHSAETRQSLAGLQLLRLSHLLSARLCKCTHVKFTADICTKYNKKNQYGEIMVVGLKGHNWPTFKASGPRLLTVTEISSGVFCHVQPSSKRRDWRLWTDSVTQRKEPAPLVTDCCSTTLVLENHSCSKADACDFRASWFTRLESCCQEIHQAPVWVEFQHLQSGPCRNTQLLTCLGITVVIFTSNCQIYQ